MHPLYSSVEKAIAEHRIKYHGYGGVDDAMKALFESYIENYMFDKNEENPLDIPNNYGLRDKVIEIAKKTAKERSEGYAKAISNPDYGWK